MPRKHRRGGLGAREQQIMDMVYQLGEASVADVLAKLPDPPSYSSVRTMIRALEAKGLLRHRQDGSRYAYRPARSREAAMRVALRHLIQTFFAGSAAGVVEAILHPSVARLTDDEIQRLEELIRQARHQEQ
jgi:predicted transcriptional regulator